MTLILLLCSKTNWKLTKKNPNSPAWLVQKLQMSFPDHNEYYCPNFYGYHYVIGLHLSENNCGRRGRRGEGKGIHFRLAWILWHWIRSDDTQGLPCPFRDIPSGPILRETLPLKASLLKIKKWKNIRGLTFELIMTRTSILLGSRGSSKKLISCEISSMISTVKMLLYEKL